LIELRAVGEKSMGRRSRLCKKADGARAPSPEERLDEEREHAADRDAAHPLHQTQLGADHGDVGKRDNVRRETGDLLLERSNAAGQGFERLLDEVETPLDGVQLLLDPLEALADLVPALVPAGEAGDRGAPSPRKRRRP
jgi:hypothetical protein